MSPSFSVCSINSLYYNDDDDDDDEEEEDYTSMPP
jgi:hypothetical protein